MTDLAQRLEQAHDLNPWNVQEGELSYSILIDCNSQTHSGERLDWVGRVAVPLEDEDGADLDLQTAATLAFHQAREHGLPAPMMVFCSWYYWEDGEEEGWVRFL